MINIEDNQIPNAYKLVCHKFIIIPQTVSKNISAFSSLSHSKSLTWVTAITSAAAFTNQIITECDTKFIIHHALNSPIASWIIQTINASNTANEINNSVLFQASGATEAKTKKLITAAGQVDRREELHHNAQTAGESIAAYKPYTGGSHAIEA